jgi:hypothetical protein
VRSANKAKVQAEEKAKRQAQKKKEALVKKALKDPLVKAKAPIKAQKAPIHEKKAVQFNGVDERGGSQPNRKTRLLRVA